MTNASNPTPAIWTNGAPLAPNKSTVCTKPRSITNKACSSESQGIPISRAKTFMVPAGSTPRIVLDFASPLTTSLSVPSPPAAITTDSPCSANRAASSRASPAYLVVCKSRHSAWRWINCNTRPFFWLRALGLKMTGYRCDLSMPDSSQMCTESATGFRWN